MNVQHAWPCFLQQGILVQILYTMRMLGLTPPVIVAKHNTPDPCLVPSDLRRHETNQLYLVTQQTPRQRCLFYLEIYPEEGVYSIPKNKDNGSKTACFTLLFCFNPTTMAIHFRPINRKLYSPQQLKRLHRYLCTCMTSYLIVYVKRECRSVLSTYYNIMLSST